MDRLLQAINDRMPKYNQKLLEDFPEASIDRLPQDIEEAWISGLKLLKTDQIAYIGKELVDPYKRAIFEMKGQNNARIIKARCSEQVLYKFKLMFKNQLKECYLYVPYLKDRCLILNGKRMSLIKGILEHVFNTVVEPDNKKKIPIGTADGSTKIKCSYAVKREGLMIRPIRALMKFYRSGFGPFMAVNEHQFFISDIISANLYSKPKSNKNAKTSIFLYLVCKYGFENALQSLGLDPSKITFVFSIQNHQDSNFYFSCRSKSSKESGHPLFICVDKESMENDLMKRVVGELLYTLGEFPKMDLRDINSKDTIVYKVMLGKLIDKAKSQRDIEALNTADNHLASCDHWIDPISLNRFQFFIPDIGNDIYGIMRYVFLNIETLMSNLNNNDLLKKRIDVTSTILIKAYATPINKNLYDAFKADELNDKIVTKLMGLKADALQVLLKPDPHGEESRALSKHITIPNDSWLACCGLDKHRPDGTPKTPFDPSMAIVESILSFRGKRVGDTGSINPFCEIDDFGNVLTPSDHHEFITQMRRILQK